MKKIIIGGFVILGVFSSPMAFALYGDTLWCKVDFMDRIQACYKTFDECKWSIKMGDCKPFKQ